MLSIQITDIKNFTKILFTTDAFDRFLLHDAQFITAFTTTIQARKNEEFYPEEEREKELAVPYISYALLRPQCLKLVQGTRMPVSFRMVLLTDPAVTKSLQKKAGFTACDVSSLTINLNFKENQLFLTTGVSYGGFTLEKSLEKRWDQTVEDFLAARNINFEKF